MPPGKGSSKGKTTAMQQVSGSPPSQDLATAYERIISLGQELLEGLQAAGDERATLHGP